MDDFGPDYISPEEIEQRRQQAADDAALRRVWWICLIVGMLVLTLVS